MNIWYFLPTRRYIRLVKHKTLNNNILNIYIDYKKRINKITSNIVS